MDEKIIFTDFVTSIDIDIQLSYLQLETGLMQHEHKAASKSNIGGYQSPDFGYLSPHMCTYHTFNELQDKCIASAQEYISNKYHKMISGKMFSWWCNVNEMGHFNQVHHHLRTDLVGVFYIKVPDNSGKLILIRNDGSQYTAMMSSETEYHIQPVAGKLYLFPGHIWHYVEPNPTNEQRMSVSFNMYTTDSESMLNKLPQ